MPDVENPPHLLSAKLRQNAMDGDVLCAFHKNLSEQLIRIILAQLDKSSSKRLSRKAKVTRLNDL